jgi:hypothetical protein
MERLDRNGPAARRARLGLDLGQLARVDRGARDGAREAASDPVRQEGARGEARRVNTPKIDAEAARRERNDGLRAV